MVAGLQLADDLGPLGLGILDALRLVKYNQMKLLLQQHRLVPRQQRVGGDVMFIAQFLEVLFAVLAVQHQQLEGGGEPLCFLPPVGHQAGGGNDQARTVGAPAVFFLQQMPRPARFCPGPCRRPGCRPGSIAQELQPIETLLLVAAQAGLQSLRDGTGEFSGNRATSR